MTEDENDDYEVDPAGAMLHRIEAETSQDLLERAVKNFVISRKPYSPENQTVVGHKTTGSVEVQVSNEETVEVHYEFKTSTEPFDSEMSNEHVENSIIVDEEESDWNETTDKGSNVKPSD
jgi:hypothetical protein